MNRRISVLFAALLVLVILGTVAPPVRAVALPGRSSTQVLRFNDFHNDFQVASAESLRVSSIGVGDAEHLHGH